jgi:hypothetical protein
VRHHYFKATSQKKTAIWALLLQLFELSKKVLTCWNCRVEKHTFPSEEHRSVTYAFYVNVLRDWPVDVWMVRNGNIFGVGI